MQFRSWTNLKNRANAMIQRRWKESSAEVALPRMLALEDRVLFNADPFADPSAMIAEVDDGLIFAELFAQIDEFATISHSGISVMTIEDLRVAADEQDMVRESISDEAYSVVLSAVTTRDVREVIIIDSSIGNFQNLIDDIALIDSEHREVIVVSAGADGMGQISEALKNYSGLQAIHILSHGNEQGIQIGGVWLGNENAAAHSDQIAGWGQSFATNGDLLLYGCDVAGNESGREFLQWLGATIQADIAASTNDTGHAVFGGDWVLEFSIGTINSGVTVSATAQQDWLGKLATISVTTFADVADGNVSSVALLLANRGADGFISLREAVLAVNAGSGGDTINLAAGTYTLSIAGIAENAAATGDLDILTSMRIFGAGSGATFIDGNGIDRVFHVLSGNITIDGLTIQGGSADGGSTGDGGGLQAETSASVFINNAVISGNSARNGGAIDNDGTLQLNYVTIDGNTSTQNGGGIANTGALTLTNVTVSNNVALGALGGGVEINQGSLTATNVTISGNSAAASGGGISSVRPITLQNVTITNNTANVGSGVHLQGVVSTDVRNTIIAANNVAADIYGSFTSLGNNLIGDGGSATGFIHGVNGDQVGTVGSPIDPLLRALQNNGGFTQTHALLVGSPAIDLGSLTGAPTSDQRGVVRDATPDIGAYEVSGALNGPATDITPNNFSTNENIDTTGGVSLGVLTASDPDVGETFTYSILAGGDAAKFSIAGAGADELVLTDGVLNFEAQSFYSVTIRVTDSIGNTYDETLIVNVNDMNDAPINIVPGAQVTGENTPVVFTSGNGNLISVTDIDAGSGQIQVTLTAANGNVTLGWPPGTAVAAGGEFRVNSEILDQQVTLDSGFFGGSTNDFGGPRGVASDPSGNFVVTWSSKNQDGDGWGIYAQRFYASGVAAGSEFRVNTTTTKDQVFSSVAMDDSGNFIITWSSDEQDGDKWGVYAQRYNAAGAAQGSEFRVNSFTSKEQLGANVAMDAAGNFVITWSSHDQDGNNWGVYAKRFDAAGTVLGGEFRVNNTTSNEQTASSVAMDDSGNFVVTWSSKDQDGDGWGVYAKRFSDSGIPQGNEFLVNSVTSKDQVFSSVAMDANGNFVVTWSSDNQDSDRWGVFAKRYNSAGVVQGSEFRVNVTTSDDQFYSSVSMDNDGDFVISWTSNAQDGVGRGIYARQFSSAGVAKGGETLVNSTTSGDQECSSVAMDGKGSFVVVWTGNGTGDSQGVLGRQFSVPTGLTFFVGDGTRDSITTFQGTMADVNAVLEGMVFTPTTGFNGLATLSVFTGDLGNTGPGGALSDTDIININVGSGNIDPTLIVPGGPLSYTENDPTTVIDSSILVSDLDSADFNGGQLLVYISGNGTRFDMLAVRNEGIGAGQIGVSGSNITYNFGAGAIIIGSFVGGTDDITPLEITFNVNANAVAAQALARNITFVNTSDDPGALPRTVEFSLTDGDGGTSIIASKLINVTATNDIPSIGPQSFNINENSPNGTVVGIVVAGDVDSGANGIPSYSITGGSGATAFAIDSTTGQITVADTNQLNFEATPSFTLTIQVLDGGTPGLSGASTITINLLDVNETPTDISPNTMSVMENTNTTPGHSLGILSASDPDTLETFTYSIQPGGDAAKFSIGGAGTNELILTDGVLDFETTSSYSVNVRVTDSAGNTWQETITVNVTDLNETPTVNNQSFGVNENTPNGTLVGTVAATDQDAGADGALTYSITGGTGSTAFSIDSTTGAITVADASQLNFEASTSFTLTVQVSDGGTPNLISAATITINLLDGNELPTDIMPNGFAIVENTDSTGGLSLGVLTASDPDSPEAFSYTILPGGEGLLFTIVGAGANELILIDGVIDFERKSSYSVTVRVTDSVGNFYDETLTITVVNQDEAPIAVDGGPYAIDEGSGMTLDGSGSSDPESSPLTYRWDLNNDGVFGDVVGVAPSLTWSTLNSWGITNQGIQTIGLAVSDGTGNTDVTTTTLMVDNLPPSALNDAGTGFETNEDNSFVTGNVLGNDTDPNGNDVLSIGGLDLTGTRGLVIDNGDGTFTYDPNGQFENLNAGDTAFDSFVYILDDEASASVFGTTTVTIHGVNDEQILVANNGLSVNEAAASTIFASSLSTSDVDDATVDLVYVVTQATTNGHLEMAANPSVVVSTFTQAQINNGEVRYVHNGSETLGDRFEFTVGDGQGTLTAGTFIIAVSAVNDAPTANGDSASTTQGIAVTIDRSSLLSNDNDVDSSSLAIQIIAGPANGILIANADGSFAYQSAIGFFGTDSFRYRLSDGSATSNTAIVTIQVVPAGSAGASTQNTPPSQTTVTTSSPTLELAPPQANVVSETMSGTAEKPMDVADQPSPKRFLGREDLAISSTRIEDQIDSENQSWTRVYVGARNSDDESSRRQESTDVNFTTRGGMFWNALDKFSRQAENITGSPILVTGGTAALTTSISVGYVVWLIRGGQVLAALMAHMPAWSLIDPLPILGSFDKRDDETEDSLQSMLDEPEPVESIAVDPSVVPTDAEVSQTA